ncbi:serine/arginine repetitive matrix protein 1-like isoform X2 [Ruditapes philippinarum]|uniref:serine/arginine repetitive matrix protein 1-like isoform X2 n=1 Tax=Ruditapes philippinarum TaxID=129788 RepID=UPI00295A97BE|nr:serine/arginine repetitive matrix protein 1-like isoform X2 [Ruditapes philippinarum]XP_060590000.1 serine/arginine repetitive matrix protein 1-like isoform X2 [Ruditapes philippinarum]
MRSKRRKNMDVSIVIVTFCLLLGNTMAAKSVYYMDSSLDCGYIGVQEIGRSQSIIVHAKTRDTSSSTQTGCTINFQTADNDATIRVDFESFIVNDCDVKLYLSGDAGGEMTKYSCGDNPSLYTADQRSVTLTLHRTTVNTNDYGFQLKITAVRDERYPLPSDSNPVAVGMVIGIVGSIFGVILIASCVGICCFRKYRANRQPFIMHKSREEFENQSNSVSVGYTNESMKGSPMSKKKLLAPSDSSDEKTDSSRKNGHTGFGRNKSSSDIPVAPPPPRPDILMNTGNKSDFRGNNYEPNKEKTTEGRQNNSVLNALHSNPKFRNSFKENERDATERAKRISSTSSFERFGNAPTPPSSQENISRPSMQPVPASRSPKREKKQKLAAIGRQPRSSSFSSDELGEIDRRRMNDDNSTASSTEVAVPKSGGEKKKTDTTHSLRPDRKGPKGRKKQTQSVSSTLDPELKASPRSGRDRIASAGQMLDNEPAPRNQRDRFLENNRDQNDPFEKMGSGRYSKRPNGRKSPRVPGKSSGRGFSHRRGRSADHLDSRPTTPSMYGSFEDLDLPSNLKRSTSKTSLYSSRSSLYDRRRRRKGSNCSYAESVASHVRDDISIGRHTRGYDDEFYSDESDFDGYEKPLSRRDRDRMYRSENDLGRRVKEIATQTLRETATQTGIEDSVIFESKRLVKKKRRSKSLSSSATQTAKKEKKKKTKSTEKLDEVGKEKGKTGTKRSKSVPDMLHTEELEKPKPKPKPRPRKSTSAATNLDETVTSGSTENLADPKNPYYPQSEGFAPHPYPPQPGYPMMAQPGYPMQPGVPAGYQYPMQGVPQGYQGYPAPSQQQLPPQQMMPPRPPPNQAAPRQPRKSNWEKLCEMTDGEYKRDDETETGSIASSVFTNNPASMQGNGPSFQPPAYNMHQFYRPIQPVINQMQAPPPQTNSVDSYENAVNGGQPQDYENANFRPVNIPAGRQDNAMRKQSSWDQLKTMTEPAKPAPTQAQQVKNNRTESVV